MEYKLTIDGQECEAIGYGQPEEGDYGQRMDGTFHRLAVKPGTGYWYRFRPIRKEHTFGVVTFVETGEYRLPRKGEWFLSPYGTPQWADSDYALPYKILKVKGMRT